MLFFIHLHPTCTPKSSLRVSNSVDRRLKSVFASQPIRHSFLPCSITSTHLCSPNGKSYSTSDEGKTPVQMSEKKEGASLTIRIFAGLLIAGLVFTSLSPLFGVLRNNISDGGEVMVTKKLGRVPVFTVTDAEGHPYMTETEDRRIRRGYFFVQPEDAKDYLETVEKENESEGSAQIFPITLNEALKYLELQGPPKSIPEKFQLLGDRHEQDLANELSNGQFKKLFGDDAVPIFYLEGLAIKDEEAPSGTQIPLFFEKEKLDETLAELKKNDPDTTLSEDKVQVFNFMDTVREIRSGADARFQRVAYIPLMQSIKSLKEFNAKK